MSSLAAGLRRLRTMTATSQTMSRHVRLEFFSTYSETNAIRNNHCMVRSFASSVPQSSSDADHSDRKRRDRMVSKEDVYQEETQRRRLSDVQISEVLDAKHAHRWVNPIIKHDATLKEAIETVIDGGLSGMMVVEIDENQHKRVVGLLTSRDLLRIMASGIKANETNDEIMNRPILKLVTPLSQVVFARPQETIGMCRTIMAKLGIKCLPILSKEGQVEGLITARDMSDFGLTAADKGGKKNYLNDLSQRVGLDINTSMAEPPLFMQARLAQEKAPLFVNTAVAELPHPFKTKLGVSRNQRDYGARDPSTDPELSEDAHFMASVKFPDDKTGVVRDFLYFGVADGVGSWREYDVDPRDFSHKLMEECENVLYEACHVASVPGQKATRAIAPEEILEKAYARVIQQNIIGSATACVAVFDSLGHKLHFSNLGDSGIIVLRHIDSAVAGTLERDKTNPRLDSTSNLRVDFVSQQQLHAFNHPYQLGWTGEEVHEKTSFKTPGDFCNRSIALRRGDIIIMATDGLFDNVDPDEIAQMGLEWEQQVGLIRGGDIRAREKRWQMGNSMTVLSAERLPEFANELCIRAREYSLDALLDSPFALLAKENDIMWSGGMPDDCTVIVAHVVGRSADDVMDKDNQ
eukprot:scaffold26564_cov122-Cylindrotheca_fusiformis.AAC.5